MFTMFSYESRERTIGSIRKYHQAKKSDGEKERKKTGTVGLWNFSLAVLSIINS
jgi:hypothetical protein